MADSPYIFEVTADNFSQVVLQGSQQTPVLVDFWADWCQPCRMLMPVLGKLAEEYKGQFILAKVNSDENQALAQQYGVRSLPTVKLFKQGQPVDEFMGALPEGQVREFLDRHIERESDKLLDQAMAVLAAGDQDSALTLLRKANDMDPGRARLAVPLARLLIDKGDAGEAEALLKALPVDERDSADAAALLAQLEFSQQASGLPDRETLEQQAEAGDLKARLQLANKLVAEGEYEAAMNHLLTIMQKDRGFEDDIGRKTLLKIFDMLGDDPLVEQYRRKMFNYLY
ncbi:MAG TPA: thioredoxin [Gammaproteobacteria bacterium]|nr:thioredoxin [Gammaproteobacteria bacterium]